MIVYRAGGVITIDLTTTSKKKDVLAFLQELTAILDSKEFDSDSDFVLIQKEKPGKEKFSTIYTINDLGFDISNVVSMIKELTVEDYSESKIDTDNLNPPLLVVFGKRINKKLVYIKLKIKEKPTKRIVCVSFHYAENEMEFPYMHKEVK